MVWDQSTIDDVGTAGLLLSLFGSASRAFGAYYAAEAQKSELKSRALSLDLEQSMSRINARAAEQEAQSILDAGNKEVGRYTMRAGQERAAEVASQGARGIEGGGSAAEVLASMDLVKEIDVHTIQLNSVRQANAARTQAVNYQNQGLLAGVSAANLRSTAGAIQPLAAAGGSLLDSGAQVADQWYWRMNRNRGRE